MKTIWHESVRNHPKPMPIDLVALQRELEAQEDRLSREPILFVAHPTEIERYRLWTIQVLHGGARFNAFAWRKPCS